MVVFKRGHRLTTGGSTGSDPQCKIADCTSAKLNYFTRQIMSTATAPDVANDVLYGACVFFSHSREDHHHDRAQSLAVFARIAARDQRTPARGHRLLD